jgi:hypothetical protein
MNIFLSFILQPQDIAVSEVLSVEVLLSFNDKTGLLLI